MVYGKALCIKVVKHLGTATLKNGNNQMLVSLLGITKNATAPRAGGRGCVFMTINIALGDVTAPKHKELLMTHGVHAPGKLRV